MNLVLDIGNTLMKFALFQGQTLLFKGLGDNAELSRFLKNRDVEFCLVSCVKKNELDILDEMLTCPIIHLSHLVQIPIKNGYYTKETLGDDRLANAVAADSLFPGKSVLVLDCGTCVKYDFIDCDGTYLGGGISPGLQMRYEALHAFTGRLPKLDPVANPQLIGNTTHSSIHSGAVNGVVAEIKGVVKEYQSIYENLTVILTGGDATFFDKELKSNIFVEPNLTLIGLNEILLYNTSH